MSVKIEPIQLPLTVTAQMVRDVLVFKGPCSLTAILSYMRLDEDYRLQVHGFLVELQDAGSVRYRTLHQVWETLISIEGF